MISKILVAYDSSPAADAALAWAKELTRTAGGVLTLLRVLPFSPMAVAPEAVVPVYPTEEDVSLAQQELRVVAQRAGVEADIEVVVGVHTGQSIVAAAREWGAHLVVMGTHGRNVFARALLGSVADYVVRHADCPVVTIRNEATERATVPGQGSTAHAPR